MRREHSFKPKQLLPMHTVGDAVTAMHPPTPHLADEVCALSVGERSTRVSPRPGFKRFHTARPPVTELPLPPSSSRHHHHHARRTEDVPGQRMQHYGLTR
jgi:hypothetical protein